MAAVSSGWVGETAFRDTTNAEKEFWDGFTTNWTSSQSSHGRRCLIVPVGGYGRTSLGIGFSKPGEGVKDASNSPMGMESSGFLGRVSRVSGPRRNSKEGRTHDRRQRNRPAHRQAHQRQED